MDSKIILAILIVALIGVVAATYHNETQEAMNTLTSVATENSPEDSVTDAVDLESASASKSSVQSQDTVKTDTGTAKATANKQQTDRSSGSSSKNKVSTNSKPKTTTATNNGNTANSNKKPASSASSPSSQYKVSKAQAISTAVSALPSNLKSSTYKVTNPTKSYPCYIISFYKKGKNVGFYEVDANSNKVTGGAFEGEVPDT